MVRFATFQFVFIAAGLIISTTMFEADTEAKDFGTSSQKGAIAGAVIGAAAYKLSKAFS